MIAVGIDIGSIMTKVVGIRDGLPIYTRILKTKPEQKLMAEEIKKEIMEKTGYPIGCIVGTGYGRRNIPGSDRSLTEITCIAKGTNKLFPYIRTVIDIGGQDSKVIKVDDQGKVRDFIMNDKCAAGTGRFLEVMASILEISIEEFGNTDIKGKNPVSITSTCTVFAESEVISHIASGKDINEIIAGIYKSIASKIASLAKRINIEKPVLFTGGVAKSRAMKEALSEELGFEIIVPDEPQIIGAFGAALIAQEYMNAKNK